MNAPWQGKQMWIWQLENVLSGNVASMIAAAKTMGLSGLIVKAWDGSAYWSQIEKIAVSGKAADLAVGAWGYSYGNNISGEIAAMEKAVTAGADWLVIDAEIEYEVSSGTTMAVALFTAIAASSFLSGPKLGYSSFGIPGYHTAFPWGVFSAHCQVALPQVYWGEFGMTPAAALTKSLAD